MESMVLKVGGMTCDGCARSVSNLLQALTGVRATDVSLQEGQAMEATVSFDPTKVNSARLREAIENAGFETE
jgi:copper chaperone